MSISPPRSSAASACWTAAWLSSAPREGVEAQSETVWRQADKYRVPRIAFINKLDREGADFYGTVEEIRTRLNCKPVPVTLPVGQGPAHVRQPFRGTVDLISMKMLCFEPPEGTEISESDIPAEVQDDAQLWRGQMLDQLSMCNDELMELLMNEQPLPEELIRRTLRDATLHRFLVPVLCGSALNNMGVQPLLDAVGAYLPSPLDKPPVEGTNPSRKPDRRTAESAASRGQTSLSAGWCSRLWPTATATCTTSASIPAG